MSDKKLPKIAGTKPEILELEAGKYYWCSCGLSQKQPFCDGSHKGPECNSELTPVAFELSEKKKVALCTCKLSKKGHLCDGSHKDCPEEE